jgi:hypothetical protein
LNNNPNILEPSRLEPQYLKAGVTYWANLITAIWQAAMEALLLVAEHDGPTMFARIGVVRALNRHVERVFNPSRKEPHWGRRKLARDR